MSARPPNENPAYLTGRRRRWGLSKATLFVLAYRVLDPCFMFAFPIAMHEPKLFSGPVT